MLIVVIVWVELWSFGLYESVCCVDVESGCKWCCICVLIVVGIFDVC